MSEFEGHSGIYYITTDVDFTADFDLAPLADELSCALSAAVFVVTRSGGRWKASGGILVEPHDPESSIAYFLNLLNSLDEESKRSWSNCMSRVFDIGYQCGDAPSTLAYDLSAGLIHRIAERSSSIRTTLYEGQADG